MKTRTVFLLSVFAMVGWAIAVVLMFTSTDWLQPASPPRAWHPRNEPATIEGPPVIVLRDLSERGFDSASLQLIEPHFHVLNSALVTIVELKQSYETSASAAHRARLLGEAVHFHTTADMHEERIEQLLSQELRDRFHGYVREHEAAAGLHGDTAWHRHADPKHRGASPGFETRGHRH